MEAFLSTHKDDRQIPMPEKHTWNGTETKKKIYYTNTGANANKRVGM
jgi:hypothetical protein